ncbi:catalase-related domain-containing protein, partial [Klebsiella michiganensis]
SQTPIEQQHIIDGFSFELSKVVREWIRERVVDQLAHIDLQLAQAVGKNLGIELTDEQRSITPPPDVYGLKKDPTLSLYALPSGD